MQLTQVRLLVDDFAACFHFYRDVMELELGFGIELFLGIPMAAA